MPWVAALVSVELLLELELEDDDSSSLDEEDSWGNKDLGGSEFFILISLSPLQFATNSEALALVGAFKRRSGQSTLDASAVVATACLICMAIFARRMPSTSTA